MARLPAVPVEKIVRIVLSVLAGGVTVAEAARDVRVSEQPVGNWKRQFLEGGPLDIVAGNSKPSSREKQLEVEVADLTQALGEAHLEARIWKKSAEGHQGPSRTSK